MERVAWMALGAALMFLSGCGQTVSYDDFDVTRANAKNALARANAALARVEELESRVDTMEARSGD